MIEWLLAPIDLSRAHDVPVSLSWHARSMVVAWTVLVPLGVLSARYFKVTPRQNWPHELDNPTWWHLHRLLQYSAGIIMLIGLGLAFARPDVVASLTPNAWIHRALGWAVIALTVAQFLSAMLRGTKGGPTAPAPDGSLRGDHYDMTRRRALFEFAHKNGGRLALILSVPVVISGLWQLNAPHWMWVAIGLWWVVLSGAAAWAERRIGVRDTYQAIWGPDPVHPGNRPTDL